MAKDPETEQTPDVKADDSEAPSSEKEVEGAEKGQEASQGEKKPKRKGRWKRWLLRLTVATPVLIIVLWIAVHKIPWLGPLVADGLRAVIGVDNVTKLEDFAYSVQDSWNRYWREGEAPKAYWDVPSALPSAAPVDADAGADAGPPPLSLFRPKKVGPVHKSWSAPGDGEWVPIIDPRFPNDDPYMFKTLLHPDRYRSWAEVFVVAIDLRRVQLHSVAGYREPKSTETGAKGYKRKALIPTEHVAVLLGAFNGGFKLEHGHYGMKIDGVTLVRPRKFACTVALYKDNEMRIASWKDVKDTEDRMLWWRQTPGCMYERGKMHPGLQMEKNTAWGATLDGKTVIRRSAIGLSDDRHTLYVSVTNDTTAQALAKGMHHAGAQDVAQLDVNWSYPKFILYRPGEAGADLVATPLAKGFEFSEDEYIRKRAIRDFFYLTIKDEKDWIRDGEDS